MPKVRETCTRCSMRRQKCDRKDPCTRCVRSGEAANCTRIWHNYDARIHRTYPGSSKRNQSVASSTDSSSSAHPRGHDSYASAPLASSGLHQQDPRSASFGYTQATSATPTSSSTSPLAYGATGVSHDESMQDISAADQGIDLEVRRLQSLLPTKQHMLQLCKYYETHLMWYHSCVHGPTFRTELHRATHQPGHLQLKDVDLLWAALLFSIISASLTCACDSKASSWGYSKEQKQSLGKDWHGASISCLNLGGYTARLHIYSLQAIQVLDMSAHSHGKSTEQFIFQGTALKIAQSLGLQRLEEDPELDDADGQVDPQNSSSRKELLVKRELGRRLWIRICTQDWFSSSAVDMYSVRRDQFSTIKPRRFDDEHMSLASEDTPLKIDFARHLYDLAELMAEFRDSITGVKDQTIKYQKVIACDSKLRALGTDPFPKSDVDEVGGPLNQPWIQWARTVARILHAHKIIMIHRAFLGHSFSDSQFVYSRWASLGASKQILLNVEAAFKDAERPSLWNEQAHLVAAGITLCLDLLNRSENEAEFVEHRQLVDQAVELLQKYDGSTLAARGVRSIHLLLNEGRERQKNFNIGQPLQKADSGEGFSWPIENQRKVQAISTEKLSASRAGNAPSTQSPEILPGQDGAQVANNNTTGEFSTGVIPNDGSATQDAMQSIETQNPLPLQAPQDFNFPIDVCGPYGVANNYPTFTSNMGWTNMYSGYFPAQSGFENFFGFDDMYAR